MANMKSTVCTKANALVKKGYTKSEAFTKAWALVKAEAIKTTMHVMSVSSDRYNAEQKATVANMSTEYRCYKFIVAPTRPICKGEKYNG